MDDKTLFSQLKTCLASSLSIPISTINMNFSQESCKKWDSLGHLKLLMYLEEIFHIKFSMRETANLTSIKKLSYAIKEKMRKRYEES